MDEWTKVQKYCQLVHCAADLGGNQEGMNTQTYVFLGPCRSWSTKLAPLLSLFVVVEVVVEVQNFAVIQKLKVWDRATRTH